MCNLGILDLANFLSTDVVYEFSSRFDSHFRFYLINEGICIDFSRVESFEGIIQRAGCTLVKLYK